MKTDTKDTLTVIAGLALLISLPLAWLTHLVVCFSTEKWGFSIAGAILFQIAVVRVIGIWFGFW